MTRRRIPVSPVTLEDLALARLEVFQRGRRPRRIVTSGPCSRALQAEVGGSLGVNNWRPDGRENVFVLLRRTVEREHPDNYALVFGIPVYRDPRQREDMVLEYDDEDEERT